MMAGKLHVRISPQEFIRLLRRGIAFGDQPPQALRNSVAFYFFRMVHEQFQRKSLGGRDKWGLVWPPLSEVTIRIKRAKRSPYPERILYDTGRLQESLSPGSLDGKGQYTRPTTDQVALLRYKSIQLGARVPYAAKHQYGLEGLPKRPIFPTEVKHLSESVRQGVEHYLRILFSSR